MSLAKQTLKTINEGNPFSFTYDNKSITKECGSKEEMGLVYNNIRRFVLSNQSLLRVEKPKIVANERSYTVTVTFKSVGNVKELADDIQKDLQRNGLGE